jgi:hypothetical protein
MTDETDTTSEVARVRPVTEFNVTYFGLSDLESEALLDLYADHAYKFAERHKHDTPLVGSRSWPTVEAWEGDEPEHAQIATQEPAGGPGVDSAGRGVSGGLDGAAASDWAKVDHTADQCQFEECPSCGCCAHGKEHVIGCSTTLDRPLGTECPNTDCACRGGAA